MSQDLYSWGRYPHTPQTGHEPGWQSEVSPLFRQMSDSHGSCLAYGNGRSYGDSCLATSDQVVHMRSLDRFIHTDWRAGIIQVEAGITLAEILAASIPQGWFLPVTPGTQFATVGGAIANDVHGKNHHLRGTFGNHVACFGLLRQGQNLLTCSASENPELFAATIGGLGLTGIIPWAEIRLMPISTSQIDGTVVRFANLAEFFA